MNSSNLSIIWGACIFASTVNEMNCVDNNDIKRINNFVCDLIDNFEAIFQNVDQKNQSVG
jgi:Rho GTPase-activating protein 15